MYFPAALRDKPVAVVLLEDYGKLILVRLLYRIVKKRSQKIIRYLVITQIVEIKIIVSALVLHLTMMVRVVLP
ncbi:hypothetical protein A2767_04550 [Candidatus Roizmanbacteria bacterium RIFCSPHIGHO2_01_FULL_35_10]|uniref:Uncharacterized protein n=1 Tax=Candidatus Roizmanbacteria bacterium RIFCSPLOWO2_01_FULL_35_13 TaxID=1802055 RepID=A0A1F7I747_9BACT|nr:MAG: hypothetical protein A2767_04550 [Candidatus Roizmanbacteria bacterium RIFCSPHIGHO2_01_FULL_35_10]OGK39181.1 MAG: hypothetical protein A3A74_03740 [Candidatus Roizmanbacteria bacterium RIFCSPLOWO2_01_FULL_35_13]